MTLIKGLPLQSFTQESILYLRVKSTPSAYSAGAHGLCAWNAAQLAKSNPELECRASALPLRVATPV